MLRHYLLMALRGFVRQRLYSFINVIGLAVGLTCVIFVVLFIRYELSYDKWIPATRNLYRVELTVRFPGRHPLALAAIPFPMGAAMRNGIPQVTGMTRLSYHMMSISSGNRQSAQMVDVVDPGFFSVIRLPLLSGTASSVFREPNSVVLSQSAARRYFGSTDPVGRVLTFNSAGCADRVSRCRSEPVAMTVTAVLKNLPQNTQLSGEVFIPNTSRAAGIPDGVRHDWFSYNSATYVALAPGARSAAVVQRARPFLDRYVGPQLRRFGFNVRASQAYQIHLTQFTRVHLNSSRWGGNLTLPVSWMTIYGVAAIGALILLTACFNFMSLSTALSVVRTREIAMRKILGASRLQLIVQFLGEAVLMALLSLALALAAAEILLPLFDRFLGLPIGFHHGAFGTLPLVLLGIAVLTGLVAGSYPALMISGLRSVQRSLADGPSRAYSWKLRNILVLIQFAASIGFGVVAGVVVSQIRYARRIDLGFQRNDIVVITNGRLEGKQQEAFANALRANPGVASVGLANVVPFENRLYYAEVHVPGRAEPETFDTVVAGPDFPVTYGIPLLAGRLLSASRGDDRLGNLGPNKGDGSQSDGRNVLINAMAAFRLGYTAQEAVGKTLKVGNEGVDIVGVLADTKIKGALQTVAPTIYGYIPNYPMNISVHMRQKSIPLTLRFIDRTWHSFVPAVAIRRYFLDEPFEALYREQGRQEALFGALALIAILIGCLGLFGMAVYSAERRAKEMGIRKVSGAHAGDIVRVMAWQISLPVLVSNIVAWPIAYWYLRRWLDGFAYRIPLSPPYFVVVSVAALLVAWATVFTHSLRLAHTHPVQALRYE